MRYVSTRGKAPGVPLSRALEDGIAPDGGLYVPEHLPRVSADGLEGASLPEVASRLLGPFFEGDPLERELDAIASEALDVPAPVTPVSGTPGPVHALELFHGPTSAFKDFGARFLAACLRRVHGGARKLTVLVATSGDTGAAVAAAFHRAAWADVVLLYPRGLVSPRQAHQLACWGGNVRTFAVRGTFDDCQRMVKEAFADDTLSSTFSLSSANSINIGRLLPQMVYYASASLQVWREEGQPASFVIPTGNLGNATACVLAREMGLPIGEIVLATNENRPVPDFLATGRWEPRPAVATLASAMDVGSPSNMERLQWLYPEVEEMRTRITAVAVSDARIGDTIRTDASTLGRVWCPHTATAAHVYRTLDAARQRKPWVIVATAHPAKFAEIVEPLVGAPVPVPDALARLLCLPRHEQELEPTLHALRGGLG